MAMVDYGAVILRDNEILNEDEMFCDMEKSLGFKVLTAQDPKNLTNQKPFNIAGEFFAYAGNRDMFCCFYKQNVVIISRLQEEYIVDTVLTATDLKRGYYYEDNNILIDINEEGMNRYAANIETNNHTFLIYFGYGVDSNYQIQLDTAFNYGFLKNEIEMISDVIWNRPVAVVNIKRKKNHCYNKKCYKLKEKYNFYYVYKKEKEE